MLEINLWISLDMATTAGCWMVDVINWKRMNPYGEVTVFSCVLTTSYSSKLSLAVSGSAAVLTWTKSSLHIGVLRCVHPLRPFEETFHGKNTRRYSVTLLTIWFEIEFTKKVQLQLLERELSNLSQFKISLLYLSYNPRWRRGQFLARRDGTGITITSANGVQKTNLTWCIYIHIYIFL